MNSPFLRFSSCWGCFPRSGHSQGASRALRANALGKHEARSGGIPLISARTSGIQCNHQGHGKKMPFPKLVSQALLVRNAAEEIAEIVLHDSTAAPPHLDISGVALNLLTHKSQHAWRRLLSAKGQRCDKTHPALLLSVHGEQRAEERGGIGPLMMCGRGAEAAASISSASHGGHKAGGWWHCGGEGGQCWGPSAASSPAG